MVVTSLASAIFFGFDLSLPSLLALCSAFVLAGIAAWKVVPDVVAERRQIDRLIALSQRLETRIERYEDLRWQLADDAARLQALLDSQEDIIFCRDARGRVTFVNRAFTRYFGLEPEDIKGRRFEPRATGEGADTRRVGNAPEPIGLAEPQRIETIDGPRDIAWIHTRITDPAIGEPVRQTIGRDVTEELRHARELAVARDEAQAANRAKSRFLASMSHEIRTPMNGILGMTALLGETRMTPDQQTFTKAIEQSARTLLALIDEILDFSKIEAGRIELRPEPIDIGECVQQVVELLAPRAFEKQLEIAWMMDPAVPRKLLGDRTRLHQILLNLIGNAIKFTARGGVSVRVSAAKCTDDRHEIQISVRDTGSGLDEQARKRVFREFERAIAPEARQEAGTGLGLAIALRLARRMDGDILLDSQPGCGATFTLAVRLKTTGPRGATTELPLAGRKVLLVSSQLVEREILTELLTAHGADVGHADAAEGLLEEAANGSHDGFDVVLFDGEEDPRAAGDALSQLVRRSDHEIFGAVLTTAGGRAEVEPFRRVGIERYLVRPIRPRSLLALLCEPLATDNSGHDRAMPARRTLVAVPRERARRRVLIAEDNEINALLAQKVLARLQCDSVLARDGQMAVELVTRSLTDGRPFDIVLMDMHMPVLDGLAAAEKIRHVCAAADKAPPVMIAVTANAFPEDRDRCLAAGMDGYLAKPFEPVDLERVIDEAAAPTSMAS